MEAASLEAAPMAVISAVDGGARWAPLAGRVVRSFSSSYTVNWIAPCDTCATICCHARAWAAGHP